SPRTSNVPCEPPFRAAPHPCADGVDHCNARLSPLIHKVRDVLHAVADALCDGLLAVPRAHLQQHVGEGRSNRWPVMRSSHFFRTSSSRIRQTHWHSAGPSFLLRPSASRLPFASAASVLGAGSWIDRTTS